MHCATSAFSAWTTCSKSCGTGTQSRSRSIRTRPATAATCVRTSETRRCNSHVALWTAWRNRGARGPRAARRVVPVASHARVSSCSRASAVVPAVQASRCARATCTHARCVIGARLHHVHQVVRRRLAAPHAHQPPAAFRRRTCPHSAETRPCNMHVCPRNCVTRGWQSWTTCTKSCGGGSQRRSRSQTEPRFGGKACPLHRDAPVQHARLPGELRHSRLDRLDYLHQVVRCWLAAPLAQPDRAALRRQGLPALHRDPPVQPRPVPDPLHRQRFQRLDHVHQVVRHRLAVALALDQDPCSPRRLRVPVPCGDAQQLARVPGELYHTWLVRVEHMHSVMRPWLPAPLAQPDRAPVRRRGRPALHRDACVQLALRGELCCGSVECLDHVHSTCGSGKQSRTRNNVQPSCGGVACPHNREARLATCTSARWTAISRRSMQHVHQVAAVDHRTATVLTCSLNSVARPARTATRRARATRTLALWTASLAAGPPGLPAPSRAALLAAPLAQPDRAALRRRGVPALHRDAPVQPRPVPDPLRVNAFSAWTTCTKSCGTGSQSRSRSITQPRPPRRLRVPVPQRRHAAATQHSCARTALFAHGEPGERLAVSARSPLPPPHSANAGW